MKRRVPAPVRAPVSGLIAVVLLALTLPVGASNTPLRLSLSPVGLLAGTEVQSLRFCRPGERPTSPRQCMQRNIRWPLR